MLKKLDTVLDLQIRKNTLAEKQIIIPNFNLSLPTHPQTELFIFQEIYACVIKASETGAKVTKIVHFHGYAKMNYFGVFTRQFFPA